MWWPGQKIKGAQRRRAEQRRAEAVAAAEHLGRVEPRFKPLIERFGLERPIITPDPFVALIGSILQQQISMKAAHAIHMRLKALCARGRITPAAIAALDEPTLRGVGLSRQKVLYVGELARHFGDGLLTPAALRKMPDDEVIDATTRVKGVGRWTAEMLLIFCLDRPDVWPVDDLGLRKGVQRFFGHKEMLAPRVLRDLGEPWRPYRTYATWYFWRSLEGPLMPGIALKQQNRKPARKRASSAAEKNHPIARRKPAPKTRKKR